MATYNTYSVEQQAFLKENAPLMSRKELTERFNEKFKVNKSVLAIKSYCNYRGWNSSEDGRYKEGNVSWQTGLSKEEYKAHFTEESFARSLKKIQEMKKTHKLGDEVIRDGIPQIVVSLEYGIPFDDRVAPKRRVVWEKLYGEIPKDHCIINLDGNPMNCDPSNLYCMPKRYVPLLAHNKWWFKDSELILTAIKWCDLFYTLRENMK